MSSALICLCLTLAAAPNNADARADVVRIDRDQDKKVELVSQEFSSNRQMLTIVLRPKKGENELSVDLEIGANDLRRMKIVVQGVKQWDKVQFYPKAKKNNLYVDLLTVKGVGVGKLDQDCVIDFTNAKAVKMIPPGGRLIFRQAYRSSFE